MFNQNQKPLFLRYINVLIIILLFTFSSCQKYSKYSEKNNTAYIQIDDIGVSKISVQKWRVGPLRRQTLSQGIRLEVVFPILKKENLQSLINKFGVESWLLRVKRRSLTGTKQLGYFYVPLTTPGRKTSNWRIKQLKKGFISIFYPAAAISSRFANFSCPAFDHRRIITEVKTSYTASIDKLISVSSAEERYFAPKVKSFSYRPSPINGGVDLIGEYVIEVAMFNSKKKRIYSNFVTLPKIGEVVKERNKRIRGCKNFTPPPRQENSDGIEKFKFGQ